MENEPQNAAEHPTAAFFSFANHPLKLRLYLLKKLPSAFFSGVKVVTANEAACTVSVPYKRFTQNPFHSTYFACLGMAAELSTGLLAMAAIQGRRPSVSMLITGMEARFHKKATGLTFFTCSDGELISEAVSAALTTGKGQEIKVYSSGKNNAGEIVAEFWFTWSFKRR
ncbi:MAG TPA: DUF4442 domain-containing protein [Flavisolibacter sp.]|nr:DUF4442 domain-containing protein [Flavisolibacter sp.]